MAKDCQCLDCTCPECCRASPAPQPADTEGCCSSCCSCSSSDEGDDGKTPCGSQLVESIQQRKQDLLSSLSILRTNQEPASIHHVLQFVEALTHSSDFLRRYHQLDDFCLDCLIHEPTYLCCLGGRGRQQGSSDCSCEECDGSAAVGCQDCAKAPPRPQVSSRHRAEARRERRQRRRRRRQPNSRHARPRRLACSSSISAAGGSASTSSCTGCCPSTSRECDSCVGCRTSLTGSSKACDAQGCNSSRGPPTSLPANHDGPLELTSDEVNAGHQVFKAYLAAAAEAAKNADARKSNKDEVVTDQRCPENRSTRSSCQCCGQEDSKPNVQELVKKQSTEACCSIFDSAASSGSNTVQSGKGAKLAGKKRKEERNLKWRESASAECNNSDCSCSSCSSDSELSADSCDDCGENSFKAKRGKRK